MAVWMTGRESLHTITEEWILPDLLLALEMLHLERAMIEASRPPE